MLDGDEKIREEIKKLFHADFILMQRGHAMPRYVERKLEAEAEQKGLKGKHKQAYIYGTLAKMDKDKKKKKQ